MSDTSKLTPLMRAAATGNTEAARYFIEVEHLDINAEGPRNSTALMFAAGSGHLDVVKLLVEHGADIDAVEETGWTASSLADDSGYRDVAQFLIASTGRDRYERRRA